MNGENGTFILDPIDNPEELSKMNIARVAEIIKSLESLGILRGNHSEYRCFPQGNILEVEYRPVGEGAGFRFCYNTGLPESTYFRIPGDNGFNTTVGATGGQDLNFVSPAFSRALVRFQDQLDELQASKEKAEKSSLPFRIEDVRARIRELIGRKKI